MWCAVVGNAWVIALFKLSQEVRSEHINYIVECVLRKSREDSRHRERNVLFSCFLVRTYI